jgi:hypothetical protein
MLIGFFIYVLIASILLALVEIQIEGEFGWAKKLPTWRRQIKIGKLGFELTGYHLFFFSLIFFLLHFRFVFQLWTLRDELFTMSAFVFMTILEDFFWFALNPAYGLKKYNKEHVYWFKSWFLGFPAFYFYVLPIAVGLLLAALSLG